MTYRRRITLLVAAAAAVLAAAALTAVLATRPTGSPAADPSPSATVDHHGQMACRVLVDPRRSPLRIDTDWDDWQVKQWGGHVWGVADTASRATTPEIAAAGQAILDYLGPNGRFEVSELIAGVIDLTWACVAAGLATPEDLTAVMSD